MEQSKKAMSILDFKNKVIEETVSLKSLCKTWSLIKLEQPIEDEFIGDIDVASGQSELLIKERFTQFNGLIENCEFKTGEKEVTLQDLDGFWEIISLQIMDIKEKFKKLEILNSNGWIQPVKCAKSNSSVQVKRKFAATKNIEALKKKTVPVISKSSIRDHILAARKKMMIKHNGEELTTTKACKENVVSPTEVLKRSAVSNSLNDSKRFDAGFFKIETPVKVYSPTSPSKKFISNGIATPKLLSSTGLKNRMKISPIIPKDYSPCMRITRSVKRRRALAQLPVDFS